MSTGKGPFAGPRVARQCVNGYKQRQQQLKAWNMGAETDEIRLYGLSNAVAGGPALVVRAHQAISERLAEVESGDERCAPAR